MENYVGRFYGAFPDVVNAYKGTRLTARNMGTEVISTGVEPLMTNPTDFKEHDPEFFDFMVSILSGDLR